MHLLKAALVGLSAMASFVAAQSTNLLFTSVPTNVEVGKSYTITYKAANINDPVTILLREGSNANLQTVATLTTSATGGSYVWKVDNYPASGNYALEITQGSDNNYSGQFPITGGTGAAVSSGSSSSSSSAAASSTIVSSSNSTSTTTETGKTSKTTASAAASTNISRNATMTSHTLTSKTKGHSAAASSTAAASSSVSGGFVSSTTHAGATSVPTNNVAAGIASPFALLFGVVGALAYLN